MANGMGSLYIGVSGLQSAQTALNTTAHNLSNINSTGYTRQQTSFATSTYLPLGSGLSTKQYGLGVKIEDIRRVRNEFVDDAYRSSNGRLGYYKSQYEAVEEVEELFGELQGVTYQESLNNLKEAINELSKNPTSTTARTSVIQQATAFMTRSDTIYQQLNDYQTTLNAQVWDACINGSSELMTNLSMSLVNILYNYQLLRLAGENGVAAYGVIMYAAFLFVAVFVGYAVGSAPIVSFHYGARNHTEVHNLYRKSLRLIAVVAVTLTLASMFIIPCVARIFVGYDAELLALTSRAFRLYALSFLIMGFNVYASSFFTALGDGVTSALISFLRTLAFQVIAILLLPLLLGIDGIWLAVTAAELAALAVSAAMLLTKDKVFHYRKA